MMRPTSRYDSRRRHVAAICAAFGALALLGATAAVAEAGQVHQTGVPTTTTTSSAGVPTTTTTTSSTGVPTTTTTSSTGVPTTTTTRPKVTTTTVKVRAATTTTSKATTTIATSTTTTAKVTTTTRSNATTSSAPPSSTTTTSIAHGPASNGRLSIDIVARAGAALLDGRILVTGAGLLPGSTVSIYVHSAPALIGSAPVSGRGRFAVSLTMPARLAPGAHHIVVNGLSVQSRHVAASEAFTVASGGVFGTIGAIPPGPLARYVAFDPRSDPGSLLVIFAGLAVVIAAVGAVIRRDRGVSGPRGSRSGQSGRSAREGYLEDVELEREEREVSGGSRGDRSRTWRWPGTRRVDQGSRTYPARLAAVSPVAGRVAVDGDYLRAMFGSGWLLLCAAAIGLGLDASARTDWFAVPPTLWLFLAVLALSVLDSTLGYLAGIAFLLGAVVAGHVTTASQVREAAGIALVWFAVPLAAAALRPLRRNVHRSIVGLWDRTADLVLAGLFGAWAAVKMSSALSGLAGYDLPIGHHVDAVALTVFGFLALRIAIETVAAHHYPRRLAAVHHVGALESGTLQTGLSLIIQISVFVFVAVAFVGTTWALYLGAGLFFAPLIPWLFADRIPKSRLVTKWSPRGLVKWSLVIVVGLVLAQLLEHLVANAAQLVRIGFILLPIPILVCWSLELFEEPPFDDGAQSAANQQHPATSEASLREASGRREWLLRLGGVPLLALAVWVVVTHGAR